MEPDLKDRLYQRRRAIDVSVCSDYIEEGHRLGWFLSDIGQLNPLYSRKQANVKIDMGALFQGIQSAAPARLDGMELVSLVKQRTSCVMYAEGEYFGVHEDSPFVEEDGRGITKLSTVLYLNDDFSGGETVFPDLQLEIVPESGKALLFAPELRHMSKPVLRGIKYIVRSEVLYRI